MDLRDKVGHKGRFIVNAADYKTLTGDEMSDDDLLDNSELDAIINSITEEELDRTLEDIQFGMDLTPEKQYTPSVSMLSMLKLLDPSNQPSSNKNERNTSDTADKSDHSDSRPVLKIVIDKVTESSTATGNTPVLRYNYGTPIYCDKCLKEIEKNNWFTLHDEFKRGFVYHFCSSNCMRAYVGHKYRHEDASPQWKLRFPPLLKDIPIRTERRH